MLSHPGAKKDNLFIIKKKSYHVLQHIIIVSAYYHYIFTGNLNKKRTSPTYSVSSDTLPYIKRAICL